MQLTQNTLFDLKTDYQNAEIAFFSVPFDGTASYRPGSRFAGAAIRSESLRGFETYSPYQHKNIEDAKVIDIGELDLPDQSSSAVLDEVYNLTKQLIKDKKIPFMVGGEHSLTLAPVKALSEKYPDMILIQFDAHTDLRDEYAGSKFSHASVMRRCHGILGDKRIFQFGIRSGEEAEFTFAKKHNFINCYNFDRLAESIDYIKDRPVYITIDVDVLDPSVMPGTGTPEPGGVTFKELLDAILQFKKLNNIIGFDVVELAPTLDQSSISTAAAIKIIRELILVK